MMRIVMIAAVLGLGTSAVPAHAADPIAGRWVTQEKDAVIAIKRCGKSLCGAIEKFLVLPAGGKDQRDVNNADPAKRERRLIGLNILTSLTPDNNLWRGEIYDPKTGRTYTSEVRRKGAGVLEVKGCFGPLCRTQEWKKAS